MSCSRVCRKQCVEVKCVLQCNAAEMMRKRDKRGNNGFNMLVRRIPVISIEDAVLHDLPLVKSGLLSQHPRAINCISLVHSILRVVAELAASKQREHRPPRIFATTSAVMDDSCDQPPSSASWRNASNSGHVAQLDCRGRFGGMKGDVRMLFQFAHAWKSRFSDESWPYIKASWVQTWPDGEHVIEAVSSYVREPADDQATLPYLRSLGPMTAKDFLPAALNFHICNIVGDVMRNELYNVLGGLYCMQAVHHITDVLKKCVAMWLFRSSCSVKLYIVFDADGDSRIDRNAESSDIDKEKKLVASIVGHDGGTCRALVHELYHAACAALTTDKQSNNQNSSQCMLTCHSPSFALRRLVKAQVIPAAQHYMYIYIYGRVPGYYCHMCIIEYYM